MTTNYHTPISFGASLESATFNERFGSLDEGITNLASGDAGLEKLVLPTSESVTISSGIATITENCHRLIVDTEGSASSDDLDNISGGTAGQRILLRIANNSRSVSVGGSITTPNNANILLTNTNQYIELFYTGSTWFVIGTDRTVIGWFGDNSQTFSGTLITPSYTSYDFNGAVNLDYMPNLAIRNWWGFRASGDTVLGVGCANPSTSGTLANANVSTGGLWGWTGTTFSTGSSSGTKAGIDSSTFNLWRHTTSFSPQLDITLRTGSDISNVRLWAGLFSASPPNADALSTTVGMGFRYTGADGGFRGVVSDGSTQVVTSLLNTVAANTVYTLRLRCDAFDGSYRFSISENVTSEFGDEATIDSIAIDDIDLGFSCVLRNTSASNRFINFSRAVFQYGV